MHKLGLALALFLLGLVTAHSQPVTNPSPVAAAGAYNSVAPTCTDGQFCWLQVDINGKLNVNATISGSGSGTSSTFGAAFPATGTAAGFNDGTNMVGGRVTSGALADNTTPPTSGIQLVQSYLMAWDGATWDRVPGTSAGGLSTTASQPTAANLNATVVGTGTFAAQTSGQANVTPTDCSGSITTGGTAQNAFTAGSTKRGFTIMNLSTELMWVSFTTTAAASTAASYALNPSSATTAGGSYSAPFGFGMNTALSVVAATTGSKFSCTWW